nr:NADH dehydrogenase subunit 2 [Fundulus majalis]
MNPYILTVLIFALGLGTTVTFASSHWLLAWMGLEINTLAFLPLMCQPHHPRAAEATTKYFLTQAAGAAMLLFASLTNAWMTGQWALEFMNDPVSSILITMALALKIGLAPLHAWLPEVLQGLDLITGLILSTWQKLAPFCLLVQIYPPNTNLLLIMGLASILIGGWGGLNQTQLRKVLAYSSIAHLGWMMLVLQFSTSLAFMSLLLYFVIAFTLFLCLKLNNSTNINSLAMSWSKAPVISSILPIVLLSLGGLPPLSGFMPKWLILQELTNQDLIPLATLAALSALLSLYFYMRISYAMTLTMSPNVLSSILPWRYPLTQQTMPLAITVSLASCLLPLTPAAIAILTL